MRAGVVVVPRARLVPWFVVADRPCPACGQHSVPDCELAGVPEARDPLGYAEIYREAFGKELSFKDPERAKLCQRLDRWIERQFSKSAAGKSALKRGAARR